MCRPQNGLGEWPRLRPVSAAWAPTSVRLIQEGRVSLCRSGPNPVPLAAPGILFPRLSRGLAAAQTRPWGQAGAVLSRWPGSQPQD